MYSCSVPSSTPLIYHTSDTDTHFFPFIFMHLLLSAARVQYFVSRDLGDGFDFPNYNELISKVLTNPKYNDMFAYQ